MKCLIQIFLIAVGVVGCCGLALSSNDDGIVWGRDDGNCRVGFKSFPTTATAGDPVAGVVVVENIGNEPVAVSLHSSDPTGQLLNIGARLNLDTKVDLTAFGKGRTDDSIRESAIRPGTKIEIPLKLSRYLDMSRSGDYRVIFKFGFRLDAGKPTTKPSELSVSSRALEIEIVEPPKMNK